MTLIFHERVGLDGRRISPFSWRIRYALAHKRLRPEIFGGGSLHAIRAWRARMIGLHGGPGDNFPLYPSNPAGPDGRAHQQEST